MALADGLYTIALRMIVLGQRVQVARTVYLDGAGMAEATCESVGNDWWTAHKAFWRPIFIPSSELVFDNVFVEQLSGGDAYGEYPIVGADRQGTRTPLTDPALAPSYMAAGVRLTVATRLTRPGQMRIPGLLRDDVFNNTLSGGFATLVATLAPTYVGDRPVGNALLPVVVQNVVVNTASLATGTPVYQPVTGFVVNPFATTQNSRKQGRGI